MASEALTLCTLFAAARLVHSAMSWYPHLIKLKCTISYTGAHRKQQYLISRLGNQVHPPVTHLKQPLYLILHKNKKMLSPRISQEVNVYYLALHSMVN